MISKVPNKQMAINISKTLNVRYIFQTVRSNQSQLKYEKKITQTIKMKIHPSKLRKDIESFFNVVDFIILCVLREDFFIFIAVDNYYKYLYL